jgi:hypothetical protein
MNVDEMRGLLGRKTGIVARLDRQRAERALIELGIPLDSEFAWFFSNYMIALFVSPASYESICDVSEPTSQVRHRTEFGHDVWELPERYVCFTTCEGEGGYLYDKESGAVFDFSLATRDAFVEGREPPRWRSFFEFMRWYLGDE